MVHAYNPSMWEVEDLNSRLTFTTEEEPVSTKKKVTKQNEFGN
jgi:hypothetical protein